MQPRQRKPRRAGALKDLPPLIIVKKILLLQVAFYVCATILILFAALVAGTAFSPDLILSWRTLRGDTTIGWTLSFVWLLNSFFGVIFILLLVSRSKLVPDFALTIHFIHLVITSFYTHEIPSNLLWWGLQGASSALMTFVGMWACQYRELRPIAFGGVSSNRRATARTIPDAHADNEDPEAAGFSRGRSRGHDRDGGGEYEMVSVKEPPEEPV
ncbi:hypothetical protein D8B26_001305 [Coccidioides posadasii str. Silveira]|uniref:Uncharacterized protein n=3 Tax=Coccidioides posadasii TaxID=199306 RepID=E9D9Z0_COCPS|nr:hypothetical protein CPC735_045930 [Coccidioides posadasii C735 delta SOWgp]EER23223.1 hypothetical protein CPC735_045930 [Coccidioides posadasii C735 delta SOWgp]EFW16721.1 conserved hypothetical protein [Coccidioides posadasii str. Silveira]KMM64517.1 hypothetical protein CPAG_00869 [Coccidioides posadasii RMSCC 3488]QVM06599.1 hypothetical protein D8B26_001305 [Coccidioides posadasii str. Silveira]|eukprot:XP_003065368.1 hypothetical protein CPC735_045930 [Coccidioides posadasii C735 delta SOWgp]